MSKKKSLQERVEEVLNNTVRPGLMADHGDIQVVEVNEEKGIVKIKLVGACSSCPMSGATFYSLVDKTLREQIPEIKAVRQVSWGSYLEY